MKTILNNISDIYFGHPFRGSIEQHEDGDAYVVQVRDINIDGDIASDEFIKTTITGRKKPEWLTDGDILFVSKGARHFATLVEALPVNTVASQSFFLIRIKPNYEHLITPGFLCWQLNQIPAQSYFQASAEGSLHVSIRRQVLEEAHVVLPPIERQNEIVKLHRTIINEKQVLLKLLNNRQLQMNSIAMQELSFTAD